ncbi:MAG TPA: carbon-nitrogen hydrolase family protein, partial [Hyphomonas sp.]|nr:carbon-nitrogen hydrolase family protein [Hyphomonas sp.]
MTTPALPARVRIASVQFEMRKISALEEFEERIAYYTRVASEYGADFVVFPELYTLQTLSLAPSLLGPKEAIAALTAYTPRFEALLTSLSVRHRINLIGGTHVTRTAAGDIRNIAYAALRDGSLHRQEKIHATPSERTYWGVSGGSENIVIHTDCGPIGIAICYDSEFPEQVRHLTDQGAMILFVPFCTDDRNGYLRVRYCCAARAIENQIYVAMSGVCGNLPNVGNMDVHYAQGAVLTPCDLPFAWNGIRAEAEPNIEGLIVADVSLADLAEARLRGTVQNLNDRRTDLYGSGWKV